jgi:hypothetical protein
MMGPEIAVRASGGAAALEARLRRLVPLWALVVVALWAPLVGDALHSWDDADLEVLNHAWRLARGQPRYRPLDGPPWSASPA